MDAYSKGLGTGIANSWIEQYTMQPTPCIVNTGQNVASSENGSTFGNCILWLVVGLVVSAITFQKKGSHQ